MWIVAGALKPSGPRESVRAMQVYEPLPGPPAETVGVVPPPVEIGVGLSLILGLATVPAAVVSAPLLIAFIIGISSAWARGLQIDCGCFGGGGHLGEGEQPRYLEEILRDIGLLLCCALLVWRPSTKFSADQLTFKTK